MRLNYYLFMLFLLALGGTKQVHAQSIVIKNNNGTENTDLLTSIRKFSFSNDQLKFNYKDDTSAFFELASIEKIHFLDVKTAVSGVSLITPELSLYPNPASNFLRFRNLTEENIPVLIYRFDGKLALQSHLSSAAASIDINAFSNGLYFVKINNQTLKFIKQ